MKKVLIGVSAFILICLGATIYVWIKRQKPNENNISYQVENKLPIEPYLIQGKTEEEKSSDVINAIEQNNESDEEKQPPMNAQLDLNSKENLKDIASKELEELKKENALLEKELKALQELKSNKKEYTKEELFPESKISIKEKKINQIQKERISTPLDINQNNKQRKILIDYGVDQIKGESGVHATNENKLFRTILSMDKISAIITQKIVSTLGGKLVGQVRDNVYSYMGRAILIPKGSKIEGEYTNQNRVGENRIQIVWTRIVTPNGVNIRLLGKTLDLEGASGAEGEVDNRYWDRYGVPLTITTTTNMGMMAVANLTQKVPSVQSQEILNQGAKDASNIGKIILQEQVKINPIITIEAGDIVFISPTKDIYFPKPKNGEILAEFFNRLEDETTEKKEKM